MTKEKPNKEEEEKKCEKCGGEVVTKILGDEVYDYCPDCNHITH